MPDEPQPRKPRRRAVPRSAAAAEVIGADHPSTPGKPRVGGPASGIPARNYSWPAFEKGNQVNLVHGAGHQGFLNLAPFAMKQAAELAEQFLGHGEVPEWLTWPQFRPQVEAWARHETKVRLLHDWCEGMSLEQQTQPTTQGGKITPLELWLSAERGAERARDKLGLTPASWAKIQRDLGLAHKAEEDALSRLAATGREIRTQRKNRVVPLTPPEGWDGDGEG